MARKQAPVAPGGGKGKPEDDLSRELQKLDAKVSTCKILNCVQVAGGRWHGNANFCAGLLKRCTKVGGGVVSFTCHFFFFIEYTS
jgi:hypothetical protein